MELKNENICKFKSTPQKHTLNNMIIMLRYLMHNKSKIWFDLIWLVA